MKSPEQLKGYVKNIAKEKKLSPQSVLQILIFERFIERLSKSDYRDKFILKGGLLISSLIGIEKRTTMDMDTTIKGFSLTEENIRNAIESIASTDVDDEISFSINTIKPIREDDFYDNFRVSLIAKYGPMEMPMKIDVTTGDIITPKEISFNFPISL